MTSTTPRASATLEVGDWVVDLHPVPNWCYQVRGVDGDYILLRAFNVVSKVRYNCSEDISRLLLIRKKKHEYVD